MSKRKKTSAAARPTTEAGETESGTTRATAPPDLGPLADATALEQEAADALRQEAPDAAHAQDEPDAKRAPPDSTPMTDAGPELVPSTEPEAAAEPEPTTEPEPMHGATTEQRTFAADTAELETELTASLVDDVPVAPDASDANANANANGASPSAVTDADRVELQRKHLRGLLEALVFASDGPIKPNELGKLASAPQKLVKELLAELKGDYAARGMHLDEVAGGWVFRTSPQYAPFVRDLTKQKPVRLTRAQVETLAIIAYRQPMTRPEVDDVRGVDTGPVLKLLLERDLVRILGKRDEPGRPLIYGTTGHFLEFFGLKSLRDLPTLREFTELSDESRDTFEEELGESPEQTNAGASEGGEAGTEEAGAEDASPPVGEEAEDEHDARVPHESMRVPVGAVGDEEERERDGESESESDSKAERDGDDVRQKGKAEVTSDAPRHDAD